MNRRDLMFIFGGAIAGWPHLVGAEQPESPARPTATLARILFTLDGSSFAITLPAAASISEPNDREIAFNLTKGGRLQRTLEFTSVVMQAEGSLKATVVLANGGRFTYDVKDDVGGGSGGPIAELAGRLELGLLAISVTCTDQGEWGREPEWCVPFLGQLEILPRSQ